MSNFWYQPQPHHSAPDTAAAAGDRDANVYVYDLAETIVRAVNVAGATRRPLLVDGPSGCGKSSLARHIGKVMDWEVHFFPVTSRTQSADLLYTVDHLARVQDAQAKQLKPISAYIRPGVLWKAFDPEGATESRASVDEPNLAPGGAFGLPQPGRHHGTVVLIDEIDKADPDIPNNLLVPLGSYEFPVPELGVTVYARTVPLIVLTTNNERKLPPAFLRRCVHLTLPAPDEQRLIEAGTAHFGTTVLASTMREVARVMGGGGGGTRSAPASIAEYLDTVRACRSLSIDPTAADWSWVRDIVLATGGQAPPP
jgi:MoxR-like ATPase